MNPIVERLGAQLADRYRFDRELGAGGMATVYLAEDLKHQRRVAFKVLRPELSAVLGAERFLKEIHVTANLQHPHLLPLFDSGSVDGLLYYVMPYVEGESLRDKLTRERQLGIDDAVRLTTQIASALDYAHRHGVVHRDIKPENILLHEGQALIADFGIALALREAGADRLTQTGLSLGTPHYMSPEQAAGDRELDARTDIYSLAAVLYESLAGEPPHTGPTVQAVVAKLLAERARPVTELRSTVPAHVAAALDVALSKLPADRFPAVSAFAEALVTPGFMNAASRTRGTPAPIDAVRLAALLGVLSVALAALAAWGWLGRQGDVEDQAVLTLPLAIADPPRDRSPWSDGVQLSPDGTRLAYYTFEGWRLLDLSSGSNVPVSREIRGLGLIFSPTGDSVALSTTSRNQQIYVASLATGQTRLVAACCAGLYSWSPSGWIYHHDSAFNLVRSRVDGASEVINAPLDGQTSGGIHAVEIDGARAVMFTRTQSGDPALAEVVVKRLPDGEVKTLLRGFDAKIAAGGYLLAAQWDGRLVGVRFDMRALAISGAPQTILADLETRAVQSGYTPNSSFSLSTNGTLAYVRRGALVADSVVVVDRRGQPVGKPMTWGGWVNQVAVSPDGKGWVSSVHPGYSSPNLWMLDPASSVPRRMTFSLNLDYYPRFIRGGASIAYSGYTARGRTWDLYEVPVSGESSPSLLLDTPGDIQQARFTRDGRWVVFCERDSLGNTDILAHRFGPDSATFTLVATRNWECGPDISPDSRFVVYESNESGRSEVYVRRLSPGSEARWQVTSGVAESVRSGPLASVGGVRYPRWSSTGRELFYLNDSRELVSVPVVTSAGVSFGQPTVLFQLDERTDWTGEMMAADAGFVLVRRRREAPGQVVLVRNFDKLLRERVDR